MTLLHDILEPGSLISLKKGTTIFRQGDKGDHMYLVITGKVEIRRHSAKGSDLRIATIEPGGFFGEMSLMESLPRSATAITLEDTRLLVIRADNFQEVVTSRPELAWRMLRALSARVRRLDEEISRLTAIIHELGGKTPYDLPDDEDEHEDSPGEDGPGPLTQEQRVSHSAAGRTLDGPKAYPPHPPEHSKYLYNKEVTCPVCGHTYVAYAVRNARLKLEERTEELRFVYRNIDPLWYSVWMCPACNVALEAGEQSLSTKQLTALGEEARTKTAQLDHVWSAERYDLDFVLKLLSTALHFATICELPAPTQARLALYRYWLLGDAAAETERLSAARREAIKALQRVFAEARENNPGAEQRLNYILGALLLKEEDLTNSYHHLMLAAKNGSGQITDMAQDLIRRIREKRRS